VPGTLNVTNELSKRETKYSSSEIEALIRVNESCEIVSIYARKHELI